MLVITVGKCVSGVSLASGNFQQYDNMQRVIHHAPANRLLKPLEGVSRYNGFTGNDVAAASMSCRWQRK